MPIDSIYAPIIDIAKAIGAFQKASFRRKDLVINTKSSNVDFVTEIDIASDERIVEAIKHYFPKDTILSEEGGLKSQDSPYTWIIDPLDGTTNYSIGHPIYAVSIARWKEGVPEFGVVYVPMLGEVYYAQAGRGAYFGDELLCVSDTKSLSTSVVATGFPYDRATAKNINTENISKMVPLVKGIRRLGAAAYDLCLVASGVYDGYWELRLGHWDFAAGQLFITEAGGVFSATKVKGGYNVICGNKTIAPLIEAVVEISDEE